MDIDDVFDNSYLETTSDLKYIDFLLLNKSLNFFVKPPMLEIRPFLFCKTISIICFGKKIKKYHNNILKWTRAINKNVTKMQAL